LLGIEGSGMGGPRLGDPPPPGQPKSSSMTATDLGGMGSSGKNSVQM
jgi:hypothetical protein